MEELSLFDNLSTPDGQFIERSSISFYDLKPLVSSRTCLQFEGSSHLFKIISVFPLSKYTVNLRISPRGLICKTEFLGGGLFEGGGCLFKV